MAVNGNTSSGGGEASGKASSSTATPSGKKFFLLKKKANPSQSQASSSAVTAESVIDGSSPPLNGTSSDLNAPSSSKNARLKTTINDEQPPLIKVKKSNNRKKTPPSSAPHNATSNTSHPFHQETSPPVPATGGWPLKGNALSKTRPGIQRKQKELLFESSSSSTSQQLTEKLSMQLTQETYECMVCIERIRSRDRIWACICCYALFHLSCINKWADSAASSTKPPPTSIGGSSSRSTMDSHSNWRCPACMNVTDHTPKYYLCFCAKFMDPVVQRIGSGLVPHSCGEICGKEKACGNHQCEDLCHPGPCSECTLVAPPFACLCGKTQLSLPCSEVLQSSFVGCCGEVCGKALNCHLHRCGKLCHQAPCAPCQVEKSVSCFCGKNSKNIPCSSRKEMENSSKPYSCNEKCDFLYPCGLHACELRCHPSSVHKSSDVCPLDPLMFPTCFCGNSLLTDRTNCSDPISSCQEVCGRGLECGHKCPDICHEGECGVCRDCTTSPCLCGRSSGEVVKCSNLNYNTSGLMEVKCKKVCNTKLSCGLHICMDLCCSNGDHPCENLCGKNLKCKRHHCLMSCNHEGPCHDCLEGVSFEELSCSCGRTVLYPPIPCGTPVPNCPYPCSKIRSCGHPNYSKHYCHPDFEDCPPCMVFMEKPCLCGLKNVPNIPCSRVLLPSCGTPCTKILPNCGHSCGRSCHSGPCTDSKNSCKKPCGKMRNCGHPCTTRCHIEKSGACEDLECKEVLTLSCVCQRRTLKIPCKPGTPTTLPCDAECQVKIRTAAMAAAMNIDTSRPSVLQSFSGWPLATVKFAVNSLSLVLSIEKQLASLVDQTSVSYFYLPPQRLAKANQIISEMVAAYGFLAEWVDQNTGKGTVIARRSTKLKQRPSVPSKLLSECAKTFNPLLPFQDEFILPLTEVKTPPPWSSNGIYIEGLDVEVMTENIELFFRGLLKGKEDPKLFWLCDTSLFAFWKRENTATEILESPESMSESPLKKVGGGIVTASVSSGLEELSISGGEGELEPGEGESATSSQQVIIEPELSLKSTAEGRFTELGWTGLTITEISVSPLGGLVDEEGMQVGHAKKREDFILRTQVSDADTYWSSASKRATSWKQYCISLD